MFSLNRILNMIHEFFYRIESKTGELFENFK